MRAKTCRFIAALGLTFMMPATAPADQTFFVSPLGNDTHPGTQQEPVATLERARQLVQEARALSAAPERTVVYLRQGAYFSSTGTHFNEQDSGTDLAPIEYRAWNNEQVCLTGGKLVTAFEPLAKDDPALSRVGLEARGYVHVTRLPEQGIADFGTHLPQGYDRQLEPAPLELFVNDAPLVLARWPNQGWAQTDPTESAAPSGFQFSSPRLQAWANEPQLWAHGFWANDWADYSDAVSHIEISSNIVTLGTASDHGLRAGARFVVTNALCELDSPGEYYLDAATGRLYVWPPEGVDLNQAKVVASLADTVVSFYGTSHVQLVGLTIEASRAMGVEIVGGENVGLSGCTIRNIGNVGVSVYGGARHGLEDCELANLGDGAIRLEGGDRATLTAGGHAVVNNHLHHFNRRGQAYRPAVNLYGVGNEVINNLVHDGAGPAVILHGNEHLVQGNEIHAVCQQLDDVGAIYLSHDWTAQGNRIVNNYLHDLGSDWAQCVVGVYLDDFASGTTVQGNAFHRLNRGVLIGGGRDNLVSNNIFAECLAGVQADNRGRTWRAEYFTASDGLLQRQLRTVLGQGSPYLQRYPKLGSLLAESPADALGNRVEVNVFSCEYAIDLHDGLGDSHVALVKNLEQGDPLFVNAAAGDLRLAPGSPAFALGFEQLPWERMGQNPDRVNAERIADEPTRRVVNVE